MTKPVIFGISDLHGYLPEIPPCDLLLLGGDYNPYRRLPDQLAWMEGPFADWLQRVPAKEIVAVAGNHDFACQTPPKGFLEALRWHYLEDSAIELFGLTIFGSPWTPPFYDWAFMAEEDKIQAKLGLMPNKVDILVTHGPPMGMLDKNKDGQSCGSERLWKKALKAKPRLHIFGHIHEQGGRQARLHGTVFANVSYVNVAYKPVYGPVDFTEIF